MRYIALMVPLASVGVAEFTIDQNTANLVVAFVTTVGLVAAIIRWVDKRIDHKIKNYAALVTVQHKTVLREISLIRELMGHPPIPVNLGDDPDKMGEGT